MISLILLGILLLTLLGLPNGQKAGLPQKDGVRLPILMYHSLLKDPAKSGDFVITPAQFESDLKWLKSKGYQSVFVQEIIDYVYQNRPLPDRCVMLTFDDGCYNNYVYAVPLLKKYGMKAVFSVVGAYTRKHSQIGGGNVNFSYCSFDDLRRLQDSGVAEIQNHSDDLHRLTGKREGSLKCSWESQGQYEAMLKNDVLSWQNDLEQVLCKRPTAFTYPFGRICKESLPIVQDMGFLASFSCVRGVNILTHDPACLYQLKRFLRTADIGPWKLQTWFGE